MGIGLSGMISGLDTDSIVKAMVSAQQTKATKIENKITLNKWTTDAWSSLNTKIYSFYTKYASKLRLQSSYMTRTAKSSNESAVTATASSSAAVGTHNLQIKQLASSQYVTGAKLGKADTYNKNTKLTEVGTGVTAGTIITITGNKGTDKEQVTKLEVTDKTTVNDFLNACKESGLTASFDTTQQRFFISSSQSGADDAFSITTSELSGTASTVFNGLNDIIDTSSLSATEKKTYDEAMATLRQNVGLIDDVLSDSYDESDKTQKAVYDAVNVIKDTAEKAYANEEAVKAETQKIKDALTAAAADTSAAIQYGSTTLTYAELEEKAEKAIESRAVSEGDAAGAKAVKELKVPAEGETGNYAKVTDLTQKKYEDAAALIADKGIAENAIDADTTLSDEDKKALKNAYAVVNTWNYEVTNEDGSKSKVGDLYSAAYTAASDAVKATTVEDEMIAQLKADQKTVYDEEVSKASKAILDAEDNADITDLKNQITASLTSAATAGTAPSANGLSALGLGEITGDQEITGGTGMAVVKASNAEFVLDGATMEETSNNFTVNGLTLNLSSTTLNKDTGDYDTVQVTVGKDGDATYDLIKEALTEYNKLIEEMNTLYNADSARGYDPLTDEQKEAMTEDDIKNWEDKIKGSLLRRDDTLGSLLSSMRTALSSSYTDEETGKTFSLSSFGIVTGNYTENGKLHIYGDEDDATYATYTDRLKKALEDDPDQVMDVLTNVFGKLYDTMTEKCAKTEISSALTFYNDKQYSNLLNDYEDDLDLMEERIKDLEDKYYKQFTAMETALSKLQSQQSSLAQMLGQTIQ